MNIKPLQGKIAIVTGGTRFVIDILYIRKEHILVDY
jgi:hypothetical protein